MKDKRGPGLGVLTVSLMLALWSCAGPPGESRAAVIAYTVSPSADGAVLSVTADMDARLLITGGSPVLQDFGQIEDVSIRQGVKLIPVSYSREGDVILLDALPGSGKLTLLYRLRTVGAPYPGYRKRLIGNGRYLMGREGIFLRLPKLPQAVVSVAWDLPAGWSLLIGEEGDQDAAATQKKLWLAGKGFLTEEVEAGEGRLRIVTPEEIAPDGDGRVPDDPSRSRTSAALKAVTPGKSLMDVFIRWSRAKDDGGNLLRLIRDETGYDPKPFFERYFRKPVEDPRVFLDHLPPFAALFVKSGGPVDFAGWLC